MSAVLVRYQKFLEGWNGSLQNVAEIVEIATLNRCLLKKVDWDKVNSLSLQCFWHFLHPKLKSVNLVAQKQ
jgi:hypothetical protein